jgi:hypothetical protein
MQKAAEILGVDDVVFVEPQFSMLPDTRYNMTLALAACDQGRLLLDEKEDPIALAFNSGNGWIIASFLHRNPSALLIEKFEDVNGEIYQEDRAVWAAAVREYFSLSLQSAYPPAVEDLNPGRRKILSDLIRRVWGEGGKVACIDCCCGSGVGSLVLRDLDFSPLSYDNDQALLSLGISTRRLLPEETMWIDATIASKYVDPVPKGIGIMMGEINSFSQDMWEQIVGELLAVSRESLITVGTEPEANLVKEWAKAAGRTTEISMNDQDPIYDIWVCRVLPA